MLSSVDLQRKPTRELIERLRAEHRERVFHAEIRWTSALGEGPTTRKTVFASSPRSSSTDAFRRLAGEVLHRLP